MRRGIWQACLAGCGSLTVFLSLACLAGPALASPVPHRAAVGYLWTCESPSWGPDRNRYPGREPDRDRLRTLTGGSSGGGWIWRASDGRYLNSVMSYGPDWPSADSFGPYFGGAVWRLYKKVGRQ